MIQSKIIPTVVKISKLRRSYEQKGLQSNQFYYVIGYDTHYIVITNEKSDKAFIVKWEDVELITSEAISFQNRQSTILLNEIQTLRHAMNKLGASLVKNSKK